MSVVAPIGNPDVVLFQPGGTEEGPLPTGIWRGETLVTGDATGGSATLIIAPSSAAESAKFMWSLEGFRHISTTIAIPPVAILQWNCAELIPIPAGPTTALTLWLAYTPLLQVGSGQVVNPPINMDLVRYITQPSGSLTFSVSLLTDNANAVSYIFVAWGYIWGKNARRFAGGPRRF